MGSLSGCDGDGGLRLQNLLHDEIVTRVGGIDGGSIQIAYVCGNHRNARAIDETGAIRIDFARSGRSSWRMHASVTCTTVVKGGVGRTQFSVGSMGDRSRSRMCAVIIAMHAQLTKLVPSTSILGAEVRFWHHGRLDRMRTNSVGRDIYERVEFGRKEEVRGGSRLMGA